MKRTVNKKFKMLRISKGITQREIERLTGIYTSKFSCFEQGYISPTKEEAQKIALAIQCSLKEISDCFPNGLEDNPKEKGATYESGK